MAFVLKPQKSAASQLRRLVADELHDAVAALSDSASVEIGVHEARKSVKKVRAVVRVLHDDLGPRDRDNERLRQIAHRLSSLRDADATGETLQQLRGRYPQVVTSKMVREFARGLEGRNRQVRARGRRLMALAARELGNLSKSLPDRVQEAGRFKAVRRGVTRGWRRANRAMKGLDVSSDAAQFHRWRRRVKDHWYQMRLLAARHPAARSRAGSLEKLERWLGDDHNLAMLRAAILAAPDRLGDARTTDIVLGCIVKYQAWLRARCLKLGHRVFARKPATFWESL
jgi:CHAD domain